MNNRKSLIIINGTLGVGKSSISKEIQSKLNNSVLIEGDLLSRKVRNFDVYDESKIFEVLTIIRE
ncbi:MAG: AAA family ATPase, partial [Bacteriovoracaceae bacterium]|nr:AAA family ATPase [Bacteriovoracaceae bacterium]